MGLARLLNTYLLAPLNLRLARAALTDKKLVRALDERLKKLEKNSADVLANLARREKRLASLDRRLRVHEADQDAFFSLARHFSPRTAIGYPKIRIGRPNDGGYVQLEDFDGISAAFSFGVGKDASWDVAIAERGIPTFQFDHTIEASPETHAKLRFFPQKIVGTPEEDGVTIGALLDFYGGDGDATNLLKIDIEGEEWPVFANADPRHLRRFSQIVCEFHNFHLAGNTGWYQAAKWAMENLATDFEVIHVHANNNSNYVLVGNVPFPQTLEVTFANRSRYQFTECSETFPTPLDQANKSDVADFYLGRFQF